MMPALLLCACGASTPAAKPAAETVTPPPTTTTTVRVEEAGAPAVEPAAETTVTPPPDAPLPPAKPTTIPLASGTDQSAEARELRAGDEAFEKEDWTGAEAHYQAARRAAPAHVAARVGVARVRIARNGAALDYGAAKGNADVTAAARELRACVAQDGAFGPAHAELGRALLMLGEGDAALAELQRAVQLLPDEAEVQSAVGIALIATGKKEDSLAPLRRSVELDPGSAPRHGNYGTVLLLLGRVADAVHEFELQAKLAGDARAHSDLGTALLAQNQLPRAVSELERAVALDGARPSYRTNLGYAYQLLGRRADAIAQYREAIRIDDKFASAWINLATALAQEPSKRAEARAALMAAKKIDPTDPRVKANLDELDALEKAPK